MDNLHASISTISDDQLDALFGDGDIKNIDETNLALGKVTVLKDKAEDVIKINQTTDLPYFDIETLEEEAEEKIKDKKTVEKKVEKAVEELPETSTVENSQLDVLRNTAKYLIEKGYWKDFEGRDEVLEGLDEEIYAELAAKQQEILREEIKTETVESTGDYGKAIIEYVQNGGNPDEVIDLFKEQKDIQSISIDSEEGMKQLVEKYYTEVYDWSPEKAKKHVNRLISDDELESEALEVQSKYNEYFKEEVETRQLRQKEVKRLEQEKQKQFVQTINSKLAERKDLTDKERRLLQKSIFEYNSALPDGTKVNQFYLKFAEMQKNPDEYLDLVAFVMNKQGYIEKERKKEDNKKVDKEWSFLKGNSALSKTTGSRHENRNSKETSGGLDFSSVLNKQ